MQASTSLGDGLDRVPMDTMVSSKNMSGSLLLPGSGGSLESVELQKLLTEDRIRADQHKTNYQMLKSEHSKLQNAYSRLENELTRVMESNRRTVERDRKEFSDSHRQLSEMQSELEELRQGQMTNQRLELIKMQVSDEVEQAYRERLSGVQAEAESYRAELNRLRYEFFFLKSVFEQQKSEQSRIQEEMKMIHEAEVTNLRSEREQLLTKQAMPDETERLKTLHRENTQLSVRVKSLTGELEELRTQKDSNSEELDQMQRLQSKQLADAQSSCRQLEAEKEALKHQAELLSRELSEVRQDLQQASTRGHDLDKQNNHLRHRLEEVEHKTQLDISQVRLEAARQRGEIEREKDQLASRLEATDAAPGPTDLEYQLQLSAAKCAQLEAAVLERERELARREAAVREEEWEKVRLAEAARAEMEGQVAAAERRLVELETSRASKLEHAEDRARQVEVEQRTVEAERDTLRRRCEQAETSLSQLRERRDTSVDDISRYEAELADSHSRLANLEAVSRERDEVAGELARVRLRVEEAGRRAEAMLSEREGEWRRERETREARVRSLEEGLSQGQARLEAVQKEARRKKVKYGNYFRSRQQRLELAEAKCEELQIENDILRKNVSFEEYNKVKRELKELRRRHQEYRSIILSPATCRTFPVGEQQSMTEEERQHQTTLRQLKDRLDTLDLRQQEQMSDLMTIQVTRTGEDDVDVAELADWAGPSGDN